MELTGWFAIVPLALASLLTGLVMALGTRWGLFRHYWVLISFVLTILANAVLLGNMQTVSFFARMASETERADAGRLRAGLRSELLHAGVGLLLLVAIQVLNIYKPRGVTPYGRRKHYEQPRVSGSIATSPAGRFADADASGDAAVPAEREETARTPRWTKVSGIIVLVVGLLLAVILHLTSHGLTGHGRPADDGMRQP